MVDRGRKGVDICYLMEAVGEGACDCAIRVTASYRCLSVTNCGQAEGTAG